MDNFHPKWNARARASSDFSAALSWRQIFSCRSLRATLAQAISRCGRFRTPTPYQKNCSPDRLPFAASRAIPHLPNRSTRPSPTCRSRFRLPPSPSAQIFYSAFCNSSSCGAYQRLFVRFVIRASARNRQKASFVTGSTRWECAPSDVFAIPHAERLAADLCRSRQYSLRRCGFFACPE